MNTTLRGRVARSLTTLLLTLLTLGLLATPAQAEDPRPDASAGLAVGVVDAQGKATGKTRYSLVADPGQQVTDHVRVANAGTTPIHLMVFATDAHNDPDGAFTLLDTAETPTHAGAWVRFDGREKVELDLAPGKSQVLPFTMSVPANATPGDHAAGIVVSSVREGEVSLDRRVAIRLYARVSGELVPSLNLSSIQGTHTGGINPFAGSVLSTATVTNTGNVALRGRVTLTGTTWFGIPVGTETFESVGEMLPGATRTLTFELPNVPAVGFVQANWLLGTSVDADAPVPGVLPSVQRGAFVLAMPWALVVLVAAAVGTWWYRRWHRQRDARLAEEWLAHTRAEAERNALAASNAQGEDS